MLIKLRVLLTIAVIGLFSSTAFAQLASVRGTVSDAATQELLPTANVYLVEAKLGATTDFSGNYEIKNVPAGQYTLTVSFVGYKKFTRQVTVGSSDVVQDIGLDADLVGLEELVVTGYGSQIKEKQTGNVASVSGDAIQNVPVPSFEQAMQGQLAGVQITAGNGKVGQGLQIRIRGASSISASNEPLYVIDGVPVITDSDAITSTNNPLADINFNDIASINVLKDASAAAIYGSRAANGVVVITTKKGRAGTTNFNVNFNQGISEPTGKRDFLNAQQYRDGFLQAARNTDFLIGDAPSRAADPNGPLPGTWEDFVEFRFDRHASGTDWRTLEVDDNWQDAAFQDASQRNFDISASGGDEKTRFFLSGGISEQDGILIDNSLIRYSGRLNVDHQANEKLNVGMNVTISRNQQERLANDNSFATPLQLVAQPPIQPIIDPETGGANGNIDLDPTSRFQTLYFNGLLYRDGTTYDAVAFRSLGNAYLNYNFTPEFKLNVEFGADVRTQNENRWFGSSVARVTGAANGSVQSRWVQQVATNSKALLNYTNVFNKVHNLNIVAGTEFNQQNTIRTNAEGQDMPTNNFRYLANAAVVTGATADYTVRNFLSYLSRVEYDYDGKYLFTLSGRVDGSSRFGIDNRYGFFPAASGGWIVSKESFLQEQKVVSFLKLKASWGLTGNAGIANFASRGLWGSNSFNGLSGISPTQLANRQLGWEQSSQLNIGVDFGFFEDRLTGQFDVYEKNTQDLLLTVNTPGITGFSSFNDNVGELENKGWELVLNSYNFIGQDFSWSTSFNIARNQNKITNIQGQVIEGGDYNRAVEGQPIGVFYTVQFAGANPMNGDAIWFLNTDPNQADIDAGTVFEHKGRFVTSDYSLAERVIVGDPNPDYIGGLTNNFSYKNFDLSVLLQFVTGNQIHNAGGLYMSASFDWFDNQTTDQLDGWTPSYDANGVEVPYNDPTVATVGNYDTMVPEARMAWGNGTQDSDRWIEDGDFLRLKNVTLSYNVPRKFMQSIGMRTARLYVTGQNLLTWTKYSGWDPEVNTDFLASNIGLGNDFYAAPQARTIIGGITLGF